MYPFAQEGGLAEACRGGDERQLAGKAALGKASAFGKACAWHKQSRVQPLDQAWAGYQRRPGWGDVEFGGQDWAIWDLDRGWHGHLSPASGVHRPAMPVRSGLPVSPVKSSPRRQFRFGLEVKLGDEDRTLGARRII